MKILLFILLSIYIASNITAQTTAHGQCRDAPMKLGEITYSMDTTCTKQHHPLTSFVVSSDNANVYAIAPGKVPLSTHLKNYEVVPVEYNGKDTFVAYLMLSKVAVKAGDILKKGDLIGTGTFNEKTGKSECAILVKVLAKMYTMADKDVMSLISKWER